MANLDNPAGLLRYWLVEQFGNFPNKADALVHASSDILGFDRDTLDGQMATLRLGVQLADLCAQVRRDVAQLPEHLHPELLLADFHQIERAIEHFSMSRQHQLQAMLTSIDPAGYRGLEYLEVFLHSNLRHAYIDESKRADLIADVRELIDGIVEDASLDIETKDFLLSRLQEVEAALRDALVTGTVRVERSAEALIGAMHRRPDLWDRIAATKWGPRVKALAVGVCMALSAGGGLPALMPGDSPELPHSIVQETDVDVDINNFLDTGTTTIDPRRVSEGGPDEGVVDAELVEDDPQSGERPLRRKG